MLQKRETGYQQAMPLIEAIQTALSGMRSQATFDKYYDASTSILSGLGYVAATASRRKRRRSTALRDSVVMETLGERDMDNKRSLKATFFEILDTLLSELRTRFNENNTLLKAITSEKLNMQALRSLEELGVKIPSEVEWELAQNLIEQERKKPSESAKSDVEILFPIRAGMESTFNVHAAIETFGCSTAVCECSFSAMARIDTLQRMSMLDSRLRNLTFAAFEKKYFARITTEDILRKFNSAKNRKIQLY